MKSVLPLLPLILAADLAAQSFPACGDAALAVAPESWNPATAVSGDLTLDGNPDVAFWTMEEGAVRLYIVACKGGEPVESWRFRVPVAAGGAESGPPVEVISPLMDSALVDHVCASDEKDECEHMRQENLRRQAVAYAGGRELRIGGPGAAGVRLRWSREHHGFMRIGG